VGPSLGYNYALTPRHEETPLNKRKKVAWRKHRVRRKKLEEKRQIGTLARRK
jgi:hypothetical protein